MLFAGRLPPRRYRAASKVMRLCACREQLRFLQPVRLAVLALVETDDVDVPVRGDGGRPQPSSIIPPGAGLDFAKLIQAFPPRLRRQASQNPNTALGRIPGARIYFGRLCGYV